MMGIDIFKKMMRLMINLKTPFKNRSKLFSLIKWLQIRSFKVRSSNQTKWLNSPSFLISKPKRLLRTQIKLQPIKKVILNKSISSNIWIKATKHNQIICSNYLNSKIWIRASWWVRKAWWRCKWIKIVIFKKEIEFKS